MAINEQPLIGVDLNLLVIFLIVFRERSVTKTAKLLKVTQPAVSGSLQRLRQCFDDPLFVRVQGGMEPTEKAVSLAQELMPAIAQIEAVLTAQMPSQKTPSADKETRD